MIDFIQSQLGDLVHECPYNPQKDYGIENVPIEEIIGRGLGMYSSFVKVYQGEYSFYVQFVDKKGNLIFYLRIVGYATPKKGRKIG